MKPTKNKPTAADPALGSWEGNREAQLRSWLKATPAQRLAWLEEALQLAWKAGAIKAKPGSVP
jgi:hypothetical protein